MLELLVCISKWTDEFPTEHITLWQCDQKWMECAWLAFLFNFNMYLKTAAEKKSPTKISVWNAQKKLNAIRIYTLHIDYRVFPFSMVRMKRCHLHSWSNQWIVDYFIILEQSRVRLILHTFEWCAFWSSSSIYIHGSRWGFCCMPRTINKMRNIFRNTKEPATEAIILFIFICIYCAVIVLFLVVI